MIILHNPCDPQSRAFVDAHPQATVIVWYPDSLPEHERRLHEAARSAYLRDGGPHPSTFPSLVVGCPAFYESQRDVTGAEVLTLRAAERRCVALSELPHVAFRIALAHAAAGEDLPADMRALWPASVPLPEEIDIVDLEPAPLALLADSSAEILPVPIDDALNAPSSI